VREQRLARALRAVPARVRARRRRRRRRGRTFAIFTSWS